MKTACVCCGITVPDLDVFTQEVICGSCQENLELLAVVGDPDEIEESERDHAWENMATMAIG